MKLIVSFNQKIFRVSPGGNEDDPGQTGMVLIKICSKYTNQPKGAHNPNLKVAMLIHMNSM